LKIKTLQRCEVFFYDWSALHKTKELNYFNNNVDELELFTPLESESNTLHVLFSESNYYKPGLTNTKVNDDGYVLPKSLSRKQFEEWLAGNKSSLDDFIDEQIHIEILGER
jgi:hypothetical protein